MLDILEFRVNPEELDQLRQCQPRPLSECVAAFTVSGRDAIWPVISWGQPHAQQQKVNVRGWFPLLDKIADEFLIWRPQGGPLFITHEGVRYRLNEDHHPGVEFLMFELTRPMVLPSYPQQPEAKTA